MELLEDLQKIIQHDCEMFGGFELSCVDFVGEVCYSLLPVEWSKVKVQCYVKQKNPLIPAG
jgi:hypothetical protein